ncbi:hypothetical protein ABOM_007921 [Aspergillus bombycis]|uniref:Protein kinase domain-containing protein n=1 Tax=Aspergillus bombycis TaxID=109264 RepID=A0A1F7ZSV6_9EURO|nr:hypothetical protein ABOM_007921 [Aspergillus bombycis]OGM42550.1 hypothetical protein ABOM_007921 [Aspergillus bombycis]
MEKAVSFPTQLTKPDDAGSAFPDTDRIDRQTSFSSTRTIVSIGVGQHQMWAARCYRWRSLKTFMAMVLCAQSLDTEELPLYDILEFFRGDGTDTELTIQCYGLRYHITVSAEDIQDDLETTKEYLSLLRKLDSEDRVDGESEDEEDDPMENVCFWIAFKCNSAMRNLSLQESNAPVQTLYDWFNIKTLALCLKALDGKLGVRSSSYQPQLAPKTKLSSIVSDLNIPSVEASKVILHDETGESPPRRPKKVSADREISTLVRIKSMGLGNAVRTPTLYELVKDQGDESTISGILLEYINHRDILADIDLDNTPRHLRAKWKYQLQDLIHRLHGAGIIWGDAKPDNVLVDADDDLWIIDFGGGITEGWVDKDKAESFEGDLQAMSRIIEMLDPDGLAG